jgi:hypothetical protein
LPIVLTLLKGENCPALPSSAPQLTVTLPKSSPPILKFFFARHFLLKQTFHHAPNFIVCICLFSYRRCLKFTLIRRTIFYSGFYPMYSLWYCIIIDIYCVCWFPRNYLPSYLHVYTFWYYSCCLTKVSTYYSSPWRYSSWC